MSALRIAFIAFVLAVLPLHGWAYAVMPAAATAMAGTACGHAAPTFGHGSAARATSLAAPPRPFVRHGAGCPAGGQSTCHVVCGLTLATVSAPAVSFLPPAAAAVPQPDDQRLPSAPPDASYRPPRA
ncbi:conserved exported hypothetical protein [Thiomonas arsenitoxydans]|uniref:Uncharacterized protein n=2 Tax=Thiomonas TaxID=32012 RepID=A0A238D7G8_THIDL|nr:MULTISPECIES: hypothetical protein [Thiomonas]CQR45666.1 conserved exported hypothetical protein [Thiomonas sp. CB3]VDY06848.1 conserved protein of unknown function [Thiomonas sp. Bio17B3]VDY09856.1 conserved protein of unknown function [Thiomonas sp. Sup16B3]CAZ89703.1 hypothetical protein; putative exported protein [Thiomonas arsenitoxydans]CDW96197.1 conserved exported hypothetical protein [Thiomonas sp. CB2]